MKHLGGEVLYVFAIRSSDKYIGPTFHIQNIELCVFTKKSNSKYLKNEEKFVQTLSSLYVGGQNGHDFAD